MSIIKTKGIEFENFTNYKEPAMFISTSICDFKCERHCGKRFCINSDLVKERTLSVDTQELINRYKNNPITKAIVIGGLEPFDTYDDLLAVLNDFRRAGVNDTIIIYTGYYKDEIVHQLDFIKNNFTNIIVKFGRFLPDWNSRYDDVLGVNLASDNQYAEVIC